MDTKCCTVEQYMHKSPTQPYNETIKSI